MVWKWNIPWIILNIKRLTSHLHTDFTLCGNDSNSQSNTNLLHIALIRRQPELIKSIEFDNRFIYMRSDWWVHSQWDISSIPTTMRRKVEFLWDSLNHSIQKIYTWFDQIPKHLFTLHLIFSVCLYISVSPELMSHPLNIIFWYPEFIPISIPIPICECQNVRKSL